MMNASVIFAVDSLEFDINTLENEYSVGIGVALDWFDTDLGAELSLKGGLLPSYIDGFELTVDHAFTTVIGGVPVTFSDFMFGAEEIQTAVQNNNFFNVIFKAGLSISACELSEICPPAAELIGDVSLLALKETEFKLRIDPFMLSAQTSLNFLEDITLAKTEFEYGTFSYSNLLLGMDGADTKGFRIKLTEGVMWNTSTVEVDISGSGECNLHSRFIGLTMEGTCNLRFDWWFIDFEKAKEGEVSFGFVGDSSGERQLVLGVREMDSDGKVKNSIYWL